MMKRGLLCLAVVVLFGGCEVGDCLGLTVQCRAVVGFTPTVYLCQAFPPGDALSGDTWTVNATSISLDGPILRAEAGDTVSVSRGSCVAQPVQLQ